MMSVLINVLGLLLITGIVWWFWLAGRKSPLQHYQESLVIQVKDGVYEPDRIEVPAGREITLSFQREDASPCAEYVVFSDLEISKQLPLNHITEVQLPKLEKREYPFTCQMKMYRGILVAS
ncbi:cupredoxin domain-containing protein [Microbulbifer pacificus]|uniref:Cupredoxin domain-containing protein n=1 Tax=Microbulbifer pacificus TaxID=407164 RepID=A0AAU0N1S9_9GAMM|nr:cupredoxin domain-containing protein [Microbulbifer pacificus]WOX06912.1 cupredoxin domain-containing protein [Microbulbifer pacificus]